jgi:hypothetical protein
MILMLMKVGSPLIPPFAKSAKDGAPDHSFSRVREEAAVILPRL